MKTMRRMNKRLSAALLLALFTGLVFAAAPVAAAPPGFGGAGGGVSIAVPGGTPKLAGHVYDDGGFIANAPVQLWQGELLVASTFTDLNGDFAFGPPGFGGAGGTLAIGLGETSTRTMVGGSIATGKHAIAGALVEWWQGESVVGSAYTDEAGGYVLAPPGFGGSSGARNRGTRALSAP